MRTVINKNTNIVICGITDDCLYELSENEMFIDTLLVVPQPLKEDGFPDDNYYALYDKKTNSINWTKNGY